MIDDGDHPDVLVFPPLLFAAPLGLGLVLHYLLPRPLLPRRIARLLGLLLMVGSGALGVGGLRALRAAGTNVDPRQPTTTIVETGPFRFTRNPLYLGFTLLYSGITLLFNARWPALLLPGVLLVLQRGVIAREERYLAAKFGDAYTDYQARVPRWL